MISLSIKKNSLNFLSTYKDINNLNVEDYDGFRKYDFNEKNLNKIKERKKIKKSQHPSKKCMIFLETSEVFLNQFTCPDEIEANQFLDWYNCLVFGENNLDNYSDYHHELDDQNFLSFYIKKETQFKYYNACSKAGLKLQALSLGILSSNYLARETFDAKSQKKYMIWAIGKDYDEILIVEDQLIKCLLTITRSSKDISIRNFIGAEDVAMECVKKLKEKMDKDLKSFDLVDKIYMYQNMPGLDMKSICNKKNKDSIIILNPLIKMANINEKKTKQLVKKQFEHYLDPRQVKKLQDNPELLKLGGEKRYATYLFTDVRGFTSMSESLPPEEVTYIMNRALTEQQEAVQKHEGMVDKYIGDAMMAIFNAPLDQPDHETRAIRCALDIVKNMEELN